MVEKAGKQERRCNCRYRVDNTSLSIKTNKPGKIVDISSGGICFEFLGKHDWPDGGLNADVLFGEDDFYLDNMPMQAVFDCDGGQENCKGNKELTLKCGFKFGALSQEQQSQLEYFIQVNSKCHCQKRRN